MTQLKIMTIKMVAPEQAPEPELVMEVQVQEEVVALELKLVMVEQETAQEWVEAELQGQQMQQG